MSVSVTVETIVGEKDTRERMTLSGPVDEVVALWEKMGRPGVSGRPRDPSFLMRYLSPELSGEAHGPTQPSAHPTPR